MQRGIFQHIMDDDSLTQLDDYKERSYLSTIEAAKYLSCDAKTIHTLIKTGVLPHQKSAGGQYRLDISDVRSLKDKDIFRDCFNNSILYNKTIKHNNIYNVNGTIQKIILGSSTSMKDLEDNSLHLMVTSPPYFNAKMYSEELEGDLGNIHDLDQWFDEISRVWKEVFRVLQPGRKAFINIMNLPIRTKKTFRSLNLTGKTIDQMEEIGFIFKRDIVWQKTNGVKAHFGTYPYPGGILINNMHEFILEFNKPEKPGFKKYGHLSSQQKEDSKLDKDFWLSLKNSDVWIMKPQNSSDGREHVAPFPYELPYRLIKAYSYIGETVLDPFGGSMTTLKAAADLKRNGIAYEINPNIIQNAVLNLYNKQDVVK